jgi:hypothetical protein
VAPARAEVEQDKPVLFLGSGEDVIGPRLPINCGWVCQIYVERQETDRGQDQKASAHELSDAVRFIFYNKVRAKAVDRCKLGRQARWCFFGLRARAA